MGRWSYGWSWCETAHWWCLIQICQKFVYEPLSYLGNSALSILYNMACHLGLPLWSVRSRRPWPWWMMSLICYWWEWNRDLPPLGSSMHLSWLNLIGDRIWSDSYLDRCLVEYCWVIENLCMSSLNQCSPCAWFAVDFHSTYHHRDKSPERYRPHLQTFHLQRFARESQPKRRKYFVHVLIS